MQNIESNLYALATAIRRRVQKSVEERAWGTWLIWVRGTQQDQPLHWFLKLSLPLVNRLRCSRGKTEGEEEGAEHKSAWSECFNEAKTFKIIEWIYHEKCWRRSIFFDTKRLFCIEHFTLLKHLWKNNLYINLQSHKTNKQTLKCCLER